MPSLNGIGRACTHHSSCKRSGHEPEKDLFETPLEAGQSEKAIRLLDPIDPNLDLEDYQRAIYAIFNVFGCTRDTIGVVAEWASKRADIDEEFHASLVISYHPDNIERVGIPALNELAYYNPVISEWLPTVEGADVIEERVYERVCRLLTRYKNSPSEQHASALRKICHALVHGVFDTEHKFRIAFPLETGMGKTTCVIALAVELQHTNKSLMIAAERIEQLDEMRSDDDQARG